MKNIKFFIPLLAGFLLAACADDTKLMISTNPTAPVLSTPSMTTTAYKADSTAYVLSLDSTGVAETFIGTKADYGVSTTVTYSLQIDKTGNNFANAQTITSSTKDSLPVTVAQLYNIITDTTGLNATIGIKTSFDVRVMATIGTNSANSHPLYSNIQTIKINPLVSLKPYTSVTPNLWYIIGLGDGNWTYSTAGIGASMFPLSVITGNAYSSAGDGTFTYTGYFKSANGFKIVSGKASNMGTWTVQWGSSDGGVTPVFESSSSQNFFVPSDGYYAITLNSISNTLSIVATTTPTSSYALIALSGDFNSWDSTTNPMSAFLTTNNHQWYATVTISSSGGIKFNNNNWANSWGTTTFPIGLGTNGGSNIPITAGTYIALFNDIDGCYYFIKQ
jgi:starch-binding outer membrane protein SusE/F